MSVRPFSIEWLHDSLSKEIGWRRQELQYIKNTIRESENNTLAQKSLIRASITLLYGHWEGFVKAATCLYIKFLQESSLDLSDASLDLVACSLAKCTETSSRTDRISKVKELVEALVNDRSMEISIYGKAETKSNLKYNVFEELCAKIGLQIPEHIQTKRQFIDIKLVDKRNSIAHGEYLDVDKKDFLKTFENTIFLMESFNAMVSNSAATAQHKRN